jgi:hypothetical protein
MHFKFAFQYKPKNWQGFSPLISLEKSRGASLGVLQLYKIDSHSKPINEIQLIVCNLFITLHSLQ